MVKIGMMIGNRYEILEKIGTGGMSDVYRAKCHKLNRFVAVKVLKQEFAENENFVSKFIIEAQAAAGLMHPNIVNVYDVGEEAGIHYIVMELIEGITLKKYIEKKARLSYKEAVSIAIQVSMGIEAAHNNHIIHRDIKPQNIIISKDGKVKVTDFGIAKAASSNTITSNVMGSVHYTSPEQARGGYSDEKSDVYSLGITMFEMLTGRVPFNGETTVAIAIKHIQEELPYPSDFVPEIPVAVESIVLKCCQKSPDRRYQNMGELLKDLKQSLLTPDEDFVVFDHPEVDGGTRTMNDWELGQVRGRSYSELSETGRIRLNREDAQGDYDGGAEDYEGDGDGSSRSGMTKMEKITAIVTVVVGIIILIIILVLSKQLLNYILPEKGGETESKSKDSPIITESSFGESISSQGSQQDTTYREMPTVEGLTVEEARRKLRLLKMMVTVEYVESEVVPSGDVISADVEAGLMIPEGSEIVLTVSSGVEGVLVPDVTGYTLEEATSRLSQVGFLVNRLDDYSDVEEGLVFNQNPVSRVKAPKGSVITVYVSRGKENVMKRVPNLVGMEQTAGTLAAIESGLSIGDISKVFNDTYGEGIICSQSYSANVYVDEGTAIDICVSLGQKRSYKCDVTIEAPSAAEAPDYRSGTAVGLRLVADTGLVLLDTTTTSFPYPVSYQSINSPGGNLTVTYTVTIAGETTTDPNTGETVVGEGKTETKSFTRRIDFVRE
ncbi:MAG: Stk1 family PASTA domain-containing Ser/Thr kinase [Lachnospiraceae bacterium]|nr:Stk1 family PASTA domain-containing Ser/Thr kinase [Lachnospiraceae bacterium]